MVYHFAGAAIYVSRCPFSDKLSQMGEDVGDVVCRVQTNTYTCRCELSKNNFRGHPRLIYPWNQRELEFHPRPLIPSSGLSVVSYSLVRQL